MTRVRDGPPARSSSLPDRGRARLYAAQHQVQALFDRSGAAPTVEIAGSTITLPVERRFSDIAAVKRYLDAVLALGWVQQTWPRAGVPVLVRTRRGRTQAHYERLGAVIAVPAVAGADAWALRELVVLHELAHHLGSDDEPSHGPAFVDRYLRLIEEIVGPEAAFLLRVALAG